MKLECSECQDIVDVEARSVVLPFVCKWCLEDAKKVEPQTITMCDKDDMTDADILQAVLDGEYCGCDDTDYADEADAAAATAIIDDLTEQLARATQAAENNYKSAECLSEKVDRQEEEIDALDQVVNAYRDVANTSDKYVDALEAAVAKRNERIRELETLAGGLNNHANPRYESWTRARGWFS